MAAEENGKKDKLNNAKKTRVIPGYHLTLGIVIAMLELIETRYPVADSSDPAGIGAGVIAQALTG